MGLRTQRKMSRCPKHDTCVHAPHVPMGSLRGKENRRHRGKCCLSFRVDKATLRSHSTSSPSADRGDRFQVGPTGNGPGAPVSPDRPTERRTQLPHHLVPLWLGASPCRRGQSTQPRGRLGSSPLVPPTHPHPPTDTQPTHRASSIMHTPD